jgi:hypothetical protein
LNGESSPFLSSRLSSLQEELMVGLRTGENRLGASSEGKLDRSMKVTIDTRHDTLEEALAVVTLAFGSNGKVSTLKPKRAAKRANSGRMQRGRSAVPTVPVGGSTLTESGSPVEGNGSSGQGATNSTAARTATAKRSARKKALTQTPTTRKAVAPRSATSATVVEAGTATKAAASNVSSTRKTASKSATANGARPKAKQASSKKTPAGQAKAQPPNPSNVAPPGQSDTIRAWARSQGMQVADAGRMSAAVIAAYNAQHS